MPVRMTLICIALYKTASKCKYMVKIHFIQPHLRSMPAGDLCIFFCHYQMKSKCQKKELSNELIYEFV